VDDVIRDFHVTGVQTCALPILIRSFCNRRLRVAVRPGAACPFCNKQDHCKTARWNPETKTEESAAGACCCGEGRDKDTLRIVLRSEESRVGNEWLYIFMHDNSQ